MTMDSPSSYAAWFDAHRRRLSSNGLWLDGTELGRPDPAEFDHARTRLLFCRLSTYAGTTASITHRMLFWAARQVPGTFVDLAFLPPAGDLTLLARDHVPHWLATSSKRAPTAFDILAVSISVPQEAMNLPSTMRHSGITLGATQRLADPTQPLVILGGNAAHAVPFLHGDADGAGSGGLVDAVCNGDGVEFIQELLKRHQAWKEAQPTGDKAAFLRQLASELPGLYVPSLYQHEKNAEGGWIITPADAALPMPVAYRTDPPESWLNGYDGAYIPFATAEQEETLPLAIGCHYRCRFCQTGWARGPETDSPVDLLTAAAHRVKAATAAADLNLLASDACSVPALNEALTALRPLFHHVSLKSLAVDSLAKEEGTREWITRLDKQEFSLGVEGISQRLRVWLGKQCDPKQLLNVLHALSPGNLRQVKLFLIATGRETGADVDEFLELLARIRLACPASRLILSVMPLFHAPFTPFQFAAVLPPDAALFQQLAHGVRNLGGELRWSADPAEIRLFNRLTRAGRHGTPALVALSLGPNGRYGENLAKNAALEGEKRLAQELGGEAALAALDAAAAHPLHLFPWDDQLCGTPRKALWKGFLRADKDVTRGGAMEENPLAEEGFYYPDGDDLFFAEYDDAEREPAPPQARNLPPEPVRPIVRRSRFVILPAASAWQPDATVARGLLRNEFLADSAVADAYAGTPVLTRLAHCHGLARLDADFWDDAAPVTPRENATIVGADWVWLVRTPHLSEAGWRRLEAWLKARKAKFQTRREDGIRRHVVAKNFHAKLGVLHVAQDTASGAAWIYCTAEGALFLDELANATNTAPEAVAIYQRAPGKCPNCQGEPCLRPIYPAPVPCPAATDVPCHCPTCQPTPA